MRDLPDPFIGNEPFGGGVADRPILTIGTWNGTELPITTDRPGTLYIANAVGKLLTTTAIAAGTGAADFTSYDIEFPGDIDVTVNLPLAVDGWHSMFLEDENGRRSFIQYLPVTFPVAGSAVTVSNPATTYVSGTTAATYTWSGAPIKLVKDNRKAAVEVRIASDVNITSLTVDGVASTVRAVSGTTTNRCYILDAPLTAANGSTGPIVINLDGSTTAIHMHVKILDDCGDVYDTAGSTSGSVTSTAISGLDIPAEGAAVLFAFTPTTDSLSFGAPFDGTSQTNTTTLARTRSCAIPSAGAQSPATVITRGGSAAVIRWVGVSWSKAA